MSIPQIKACLKACNRRDAALSLQMIQCVHAANAPLHAGREGGTLFDQAMASFKRIMSPKEPRHFSQKMNAELEEKLMAKVRKTMELRA